jgi:hypothetical protein
MSQMSNYLENELLDHTLGTGSWTMPTTIYLALFTSNPTDAGSGTEVSGSGYARQAVTFGAAASGSATNSSQETFTASGGNFGTVTHIGIYDASTAGNLLVYGALTSSRTINDGESLIFEVGSITVTFA